MSNKFQNNDKHIHGDVQDPNVTEATTPLDDAACCASLFVEGVCVESSRFPHWIGKTADQILDIIEDGVQEIASRRGVSLHRFENRDLALNELDA